MHALHPQYMYIHTYSVIIGFSNIKVHAFKDKQCNNIILLVYIFANTTEYMIVLHIKINVN